MLRIHAPLGHPHQSELTTRLDQELDRFLVGGGSAGQIMDHDLLERHGDIVAAADSFLKGSGSAVIVDITALPKRFFFPLLKFILADTSKTDVIATYSIPHKYSDGPLYQDVESPGYLPSFMPSITDEDDIRPHILAVAVGFDSPGLAQVLEEEQGEDVLYMFPFPAPPPIARHTWEFLQEADAITDRRRSRTAGVSARDPGSAYELLLSATDRGRRECVLAPYGPKPVSLAMCLYALGPGRQTCSVRYSQPKYYNPEYSVGTATDVDGVVSYAYLLRTAGRDWYA